MMWLAEKYMAVIAGSGERDLDAFVDDIFACKKFEFWQLNRDEVLSELSQMTERTYAELCAALYGLHAAKAGKSGAYLGDKNNFHTRHTGDLDRLFPDCKFIHIIRDGRDVATSYMALNDSAPASEYYPRVPHEIEAIAREWSGNISSVHDYLNQLPQSRWVEVRYEDVVTDTQATLERVCAHLDIEFSAAMLGYHIANKRDSLEPSEFMAWKSRTLEKVDSSSIGRYKTLERESVQAFEAIASRQLLQYCYV